MRWPWQRIGHDAKDALAEAERELVRARRRRPVIERLGEALAADVSPEELAERMRRALTVRHP